MIENDAGNDNDDDDNDDNDDNDDDNDMRWCSSNLKPDATYRLTRRQACTATRRPTSPSCV